MHSNKSAKQLMTNVFIVYSLFSLCRLSINIDIALLAGVSLLPQWGSGDNWFCMALTWEEWQFCFVPLPHTNLTNLCLWSYNVGCKGDMKTILCKFNNFITEELSWNCCLNKISLWWIQYFYGEFMVDEAVVNHFPL